MDRMSPLWRYQTPSSHFLPSFPLVPFSKVSLLRICYLSRSRTSSCSLVSASAQSGRTTEEFAPRARRVLQSQAKVPGHRLSFPLSDCKNMSRGVNVTILPKRTCILSLSTYLAVRTGPRARKRLRKSFEPAVPTAKTCPSTSSRSDSARSL